MNLSFKCMIVWAIQMCGGQLGVQLIRNSENLQVLLYGVQGLLVQFQMCILLCQLLFGHSGSKIWIFSSVSNGVWIVMTFKLNCSSQSN